MNKLSILAASVFAGLCLVGAAPVWELERPFTGGAAGEELSVPIVGSFPARSGSVTARFRLNRDMPAGEQAANLFDYLATPEYYDRLLLRVLHNPKGGYFIEFTACETDRGRYAGYHLRYPAELVPNEWHTVGIAWEKVNSGEADASLKLYFDGTLVEELSNFELSIKDNATHFFAGGVHPPFPGTASNILQVEKLTLWPEALSPAEFHAFAGLKTEAPAPAASLRVGKASGIVIDGVWEEAEWKDTAAASPFVLRRQGSFAPYDTDLRLAHADGKLYIGWRAATDGEPLAKNRAHDGPLWYDDSIELLFSADGKDVVHVICNPLDAIYDERSGDGGGSYAPEWDGVWNYRSRYEDKVWTGELEIDLAANKLPAIREGTVWRFNAVRNGFSPQMESSWTLSPAGSIKEADRLGWIGFVDALPHVRIAALPEFFPGTASLALELAGGVETKVEFVLANAERQWCSSRRFPASESGVRSFAVTIPSSGDYTGEVTVTAAGTGMILRRPFAVHVEQPLVLELNLGSPLETVTATADLSRIDTPFAAARVRLLDAQDMTLAEEMLPGRGGSCTFALESLPEGDYAAVLELVDASGLVTAQRRQRFHRYVRPEHISNAAGRDTAWQHWTPVERRDGSIFTWNREYRFDGTIFPAQMISAGRELLRGTPEFQYRVGDENKVLSAAQVRCVSETPEQVVLALDGANEYLQVSGTVAIEYDGALLYELHFLPGHDRIRDFALRIPLAPDSAQMVLEGTEHTFRTEKNVIGKSGWQRKMPFQFKFGVGNGDRALYWFIESDRGWQPYGRDDTVTVTRTDDAVEVKLQVVAGEHALGAASWNCGFIATPVKPVDFDLDSLRVVHAWPGGPYFSSDPANYRQFHIGEAYELGARVIVLHEFWPLFYGGSEPVNPEDLKRFVNEAHALGMRVVLYRSHLANTAEPSQGYFNRSWLAYPIVAYVSSESRPHTDGVTRCPEGEEFVDYSVGVNEALLLEYDLDGFYYDIAANPCANGSHGCGYSGAETTEPTPGSVLTIGMDTLEHAPNPYAGRRVTWPLVKEREFWQRMYNMVHEHRGERGLVIAHVSWATDAIYCGFSDSVCHSEFSACYWDGRTLPTPEEYRCFFSKRLWGLPGNYLCYQPAQRSLLGMALLHQESYWMKTYGNNSAFDEENYGPLRKLWGILEEFGVDEAQWHGYYDEPPELAVTGNNCLRSFWSKPDKSLVVVANVGNTEAAAVTLSAPGFRRAVDRWRGDRQLEPAGDEFRFTLAPQEFTLIEVQR